MINVHFDVRYGRRVMIKNHAFFMQKAFEEALKAYGKDEVPVGAVLIDGKQRVIACAHNQIEAESCALYHAEMRVIEMACQKLGDKKLTTCTLYVTLEPCTMCAGAIAHAGIKTLCYGAYDPKGGAVDHGVCFFEQETCHHTPEVISGIMEEACSDLLKRYFKGKRR